MVKNIPPSVWKINGEKWSRVTLSLPSVLWLWKRGAIIVAERASFGGR